MDRLSVDDLGQNGELPPHGSDIEAHASLRARQTARASGVSMSVIAAFARHLDFAHQVGMLADQMLGADIAGELGHLGKEAPRPQHRVAALAGRRSARRWRGLRPG